MIAFIKGRIIEKDPDRLVVLVGGLGLEVKAPAGTIDKSPGVGEEASLFTYLHVREDVLQLYGFDTARARGLFLKLMSIKGFGAQKALSVLSIFSPERFESIVSMGDAASLTDIPGVGTKGAERLILEMKDKVQPSTLDIAGVPDAGKFTVQEAVEALVAMDFTRLEAHDALKKYPFKGEEPTVEELLQFALKELGRR
jgi:holliday junction DNA helicase RuvA